MGNIEKDLKEWEISARDSSNKAFKTTIKAYNMKDVIQQFNTNHMGCRWTVCKPKKNMKIINREDIVGEEYRLVLDTETHHDHEIFEDDRGVYRWKENHIINNLLEKVSLNDLINELYNLGYDKNSEIYRKLYRDLGYSLYGYWEVFYWETNNELASEYIPNKPI